MDWINSKYSKDFRLEYDKWKRFVTEVVIMPQGAGKDFCGAICDFDSTCDMFAYSGVNCYKGDFSRSTNTDPAGIIMSSLLCSASDGVHVST